MLGEGNKNVPPSYGQLFVTSLFISIYLYLGLFYPF